MTSRPRLITSIPFWILLAGSLAATVAGGWIALTRLATMVAGLNAQSATTAEVYGGQSWIVIGAALLGAGLIGLVVVLALAVVRRLITPAPAVVEQTDDVAIAGDDLPFVEVAAPAADVDAPAASADDESVESPAEERSDAPAIR